MKRQPPSQDMDAHINRLKKLDILSGIGAGVLGAGIALLLAKWLQAFALPALLIGIAVHGWAMLEKNRMERQAQLVQPAWTVIAYWACWRMLLALILYVALTLLR